MSPAMSSSVHSDVATTRPQEAAVTSPVTIRNYSELIAFAPHLLGFLA